VRPGVAGPKLDGLAELLLGGDELTGISETHSESAARLGKGAVQCHRPARQKPGSVQRCARRGVVIVGEEAIHTGKPGIAQGEPGILFDGTAVIFAGCLHPGEAPIQLGMPASEVEVSEVQLLGCRVGRTSHGVSKMVLWLGRDVNLPRDGLSQLTLDQEHLTEIALIALSPEVSVRGPVHQLRGDTDPPAFP
jgi:hypothetical protein